MPAGADVYGFLYDGHRAINDPGAIYPQSVLLIERGFVFVTLYPPPQLLIAAIYASIPGQFGAVAWVLTDALAAVAALVLVFRFVRDSHPAALPIFCLLVICFTPLFEDVRLGQRSGLLLMLSVGSMAAIASRPAAAGILAGIATALKFYPGAMVLAVDPRKQLTFIATLAATAALILGASFIPFGSPLFYFTRVFLPSITWQRSGPHDCFQNSTQLLFARVVGGESYGVIDQSGVWRPSSFVPWHFTTASTILGYAAVGLIVVAAVWAVRRSGVAQPYSLALCFSLGTLVPGEVFTYQFVPMLPLFIVMFMKALQHGKVGTMLILASALWVLLISPCALPLPSLWTVAALGIFATSVVWAPLFRNTGAPAGTSRGSAAD